MARRRFGQLPRRESPACFRSSRHRLSGRINSALPDGTFRDWRSGESFLRCLHLGRARTPDSSRVCHLYSFASPRRPRPASGLAYNFGSRMSRNELVAGPVICSPKTRAVGSDAVTAAKFKIFTRSHSKFEFRTRIEQLEAALVRYPSIHHIVARGAHATICS